jgi:hypothetical protein
MTGRVCFSILMCSTRSEHDKRLGPRVPLPAHRTRHCLMRSCSTLSPRFKTVDMEVMSTYSFCSCFCREVTVAHSTLRRDFRGWWKQVSTLRMSLTHWITLVLGALALRPTSDHLLAPLVFLRNTSWSRILYMNPTRRKPI